MKDNILEIRKTRPVASVVANLERMLAHAKAGTHRRGTDQERTKGAAEMIEEVEADQLVQRLAGILENPTVQQLDPRHNVPWPLE